MYLPRAGELAAIFLGTLAAGPAPARSRSHLSQRRHTPAHDVAAANIRPLSKLIRFDTASFPDIVGKTEGMALLSDGSLALINGDDFGMVGGRSQVVMVRGRGVERR